MDEIPFTCEHCHQSASGIVLNKTRGRAIFLCGTCCGLLQRMAEEGISAAERMIRLQAWMRRRQRVAGL